MQIESIPIAHKSQMLLGVKGLKLALQYTDDPSRVYPSSWPLSVGIGSSAPPQPSNVKVVSMDGCW